MRHLDIAPCDCRTSQGATRQLRTLRHPHIAPCDIALSHPATFACRTLRLKNIDFDPKITINCRHAMPMMPIILRSARAQEIRAFFVTHERRWIWYNTLVRLRGGRTAAMPSVRFPAWLALRSALREGWGKAKNSSRNHVWDASRESVGADSQ